MCTAISDIKGTHLFGRTLDLDCSYGESVAIVPRGYELSFLHEQVIPSHAIIGACHISNGVPLFYDATNEHGLCMAGLNFPKLASYNEVKAGQINVASFELIPFILRQCRSCKSAISLLKRINITNDAFSSELKPTPLHWLMADMECAYVIEPTNDGLKIYENPLRVLTNAPEFSYHLANVCNYKSLSSYDKDSTLSNSLELQSYSNGMGAIGLPGDFSSASRFIRAVFAREHASFDSDEIGRFFSILNTVFIPLGCVKTDTGRDFCSIYVSCINAESGSYYFSTYGSKRIQCVRMNDVNLNSSELFSYNMSRCSEYKFLN